MSSHKKNISLLLIGILIIAFFSSVTPVLGDAGDPIITVDGIGDDDWNPNLKIMDDVNESGVPDGYDIKALYQYYDGREGWDTLYFRYDVYGIAGDSDDDGDPHNGTYWTDRWGVNEDEIYTIFIDTDLNTSTGWVFPAVVGGFDLRIEYNNNSAFIKYFTTSGTILTSSNDNNGLFGEGIVEDYLHGLLVGNGNGDRVEAAIRTDYPYNNVVEIGVKNATSLFTAPANPRYYRIYGYADYYTFWVGGEDYLENELDIRAPELNFTTQDICCYNISFNGTTDLELTNCTWEFGDGDIVDCDPACMEITHQYADGGYYKVNFSGYRSNGMYGYTQQTIYVDRGPTVIATANQTDLGVPAYVELNGSGSHADPIGNRTINYTWSFDDWHEDMTGEVVTVLVNTTVNATLSVFDGHCYSNTTLLIEYDPVPPELNFTTTAICCFNQSFNATTNATLANCTWDFGDGDIVDCDPACMEITHQYADGGNFTVTFSGYRADNGEYGEAIQTIYVDRGPTVIATANQTDLGVPAYVELNGSGSHADPIGNRTINYTWSFDDWHEDMTGEVVTIYVNTTVNATLTVFDGHCTNTTDNETGVTILYEKTPLKLNFTTDDICCFNQSFNETTNATLANCTWEFGDGTILECDPPCLNTWHQYSEGGNFTVTFSGYRADNGEYNSITKEIYVDRGPVAIARANVTFIGAPAMVEFNGSRSHPDPYGNRNISRYEWEFDDGVNLSGKVVVREINQTTTAKLTVFDNSSDGIEHCSVSEEVTVKRSSYPVPATSYPGILLLIGLLAVIGALNLQRSSRRRR